MNGDLLTDLDFRAMIRAHREAGAAATVGLYTRDVKIDLGVVETNACSQITHYREKPVYHYQVSMGVYVFEPTVLRFIPREMRLDMPELVRKLLDIGRPDDYQTAQDDFERMSSTLLGNGSAPSVHRQILLNDYARVSPAVPTNGRMQKSA
jgi:NDP-sugar pyrophosphorylase family protein